MATIKEIKSAIRKLQSKDLAVLRKWFADFDAEQWDRQLEDDVEAGRLDRLAEKALGDAKEGRCTDL